MMAGWQDYIAVMAEELWLVQICLEPVAHLKLVKIFRHVAASSRRPTPVGTLHVSQLYFVLSASIRWYDGGLDSIVYLPCHCWDIM